MTQDQCIDLAIYHSKHECPIENCGHIRPPYHKCPKKNSQNLDGGWVGGLKNKPPISLHKLHNI